MGQIEMLVVEALLVLAYAVCGRVRKGSRTVWKAEFEVDRRGGQKTVKFKIRKRGKWPTSTGYIEVVSTRKT